jgi:NADH-quinone oxidoreductase subunit J
MLGAYKGMAMNSVASSTVNQSAGLTKNLGELLFNQYVLPFELASVLILAGIVGAVLIGKKDI